MKQGKTLVELATEIDRQAQHKQDFIVKSQVLKMCSNSSATSLSTLGDEVYGEYQVNDLTHKQIGQHLSIPAIYYTRLRAEQPRLLDENVNTLLAASAESERRMVRTVDGTARAFLSDRYRRLDNFDLLEAVLPTLMEMPGLEIASCDVTEQKLYLKVTTSRIQAEVQPGDVVRGAMSELVFSRIVSQVREAAGAKLDSDPVQAVEVLCRKHSLNSD